MKKASTLAPSAISAMLAVSIAASTAGIAVLASVLPAHAGQLGRTETTADGSKLNAPMNSQSGASGNLHCKGGTCPGSHTGDGGTVTGSAAKGDPNPIVRDHRGGATGGGVTVTDGKPRPRGGSLCAGWFC